MNKIQELLRQIKDKSKAIEKLTSLEKSLITYHEIHPMYQLLGKLVFEESIKNGEQNEN